MENRPTQLANLLDVEDHEAIIEEIKTISSIVFPRFNFELLDQTYRDIIRLFHGEYPGYRRSNVKYHNLNHTLSVTLAMARLMHGAAESGLILTEKEFNLGFAGALMHDTGYIQQSDDTRGTGAKYTLSHISRSIEFAEQYYQNNPLFENDRHAFKDILKCTGLNTRIEEIHFPTEKIEILGQMLGTADLLGQMADRYYLEKLLFLYDEFIEAGIMTFTSKLDLLEKTMKFYDMTRKRFSDGLGGAYRFSRYHFRKRWDIDEDLYMKSIESNLAYLKYIISHHKHEYHNCLRRLIPNDVHHEW